MITFSENQQQLVDRLKTERMSQAEFEQYAKEHGYIISTTNIIEQITAEIYEEFMTIDGGVHDKSALKCMEIIDKYKASEEISERNMKMWEEIFKAESEDKK